MDSGRHSTFPHDGRACATFRSAIFSAWQDAVATELCKRKCFRGKFGFDMFGSHQLQASSRLKETKSHVFWVKFGMGFHSVKPTMRICHIGFVVILTGMATYSGIVLFSLFPTSQQPGVCFSFEAG